MRHLICIPTYNEAENIRSLVGAVLAASRELSTQDSVDILIIDDNSPDGTGRVADELASASEKRVHVLHREKKMGLGTAYVNGFKWGLDQGYDALIEMDADFSHDPKYIPEMVRVLKDNDVAIGSRYVPGGGTVNWGLGRRMLSQGGSLYARSILGVRLRDLTGGFNGWRRKVLESVELSTLRSDGYSFQIELKYRAVKKGFRIHEFPIVFEDRKVGKSKMNKKIVLEALRRVWSFRSYS